MTTISGSAALLAISGRLIDMCRINFVSSVGTLGKDPDDFQVSVFGLLHIIILIGTQRVTVFSPDGAYLAVAGGKEVCSPVNLPKFSYFKLASVVRLDVPRPCIHQRTHRSG